MLENHTQELEFVVDSTLPVVTSNFDKLKANLTEKLKKYELEVTQQNIPEARKLAAQLNKIAGSIDDKKKEILQRIELPTNLFKENVKELIKMCEDGRKALTNQIKVFEDKLKEEYLQLLKTELNEQYIALGIGIEFQTVKVDDLAIMSSITETQKLSKTGKDTIRMRVAASLTLQHTVLMRLVELENTSLKAGLKAPLQRRHVESFLKDFESAYQTKLEQLLICEIKRQEEIEQQIIAQQQLKIRKEAEEKVRQDTIVHQNKATIDSGIVMLNPIAHHSKEVKKALTHAAVTQNPSQTKDTFTIIATFCVEQVKGAFTNEQVKELFATKLQTSGFKSLQNISVVKE
jgi:hypothetical protein